MSALFPDTRIVGEEGGTTGPDGSASWIIDPIDGTKAYVTGVPLWGVLLGLVVAGRPVAGWCRQPYLDETFAAIAGRGWLEHAGTRRPLASSSTTDLSEASMYSTHPSMFEAQWEQDAFGALAAQVRLQRFGGDCYSYCLLAAGHIDLVVEAGLQPYDIVPLIPIVEAAGGVVTGPGGEPPLAGGFIIAAATPELHHAALEIGDPGGRRAQPPRRHAMSDYPYADRFAVHRALPEQGRPRDEVLAELETMARRRTPSGRRASARAPCTAATTSTTTSSTRPSGCSPTSTPCSATCARAPPTSRARSSPWPSTCSTPRRVAGTTPAGLVTTGGTGSILHAVLAYREQAAQQRA